MLSQLSPLQPAVGGYHWDSAILKKSVEFSGWSEFLKAMSALSVGQSATN